MYKIKDSDINVYVYNLYQEYRTAVFRESIEHSIDPVQTYWVK